MEFRARSSALCQREFAFRVTATFSCRWLICVRIMIFSLAEITRLFPRSGGSNRMRHCSRPEQNSTPSQPISPISRCPSPGRQVSAKLLLEFSVGEYRYLLAVLLAAVACVFVIACANVANLQLARGLARRKELAVRAALGASRWDLARQMLVESGVVALLGGLCAVLIALWSLDTIRALVPPNVPRFQETNIDALCLGSRQSFQCWPDCSLECARVPRLEYSSVASELHEEARAAVAAHNDNAPAEARDCTSRSCGRVARSGRINTEEFLAFAAGALDSIRVEC
jgi:hypothetical protein